MTTYLKRALILLSISAIAGGTAAAASTTSSAASASGGILRVNMGQAPTTLDPSWAVNLGEAGFSQSFYVQLTKYGTKPGSNGTVQSDPSHVVLYFAKRMQISNNHTRYTFSLPAGVKFPSGTPVDAVAVKYSFERALKMNGAGAFYLVDGFVAPLLIKRITAPSATKVVIDLIHPDPNLPQALAQPGASIVDPSTVKAHGGVQANKPNAWMTSHIAGSGPFLLKEYQPGVKAVLVANPNFFGTPPASKEIDVNFIASDSTLLLQARNGGADVTTGMTKQAAASLKGNSNLRLVVNDTNQYEELGMVDSKAPFNNVRVRRALAYAVPYQEIVNKVAYGFGGLWSGPYPPTVPGFSPSIEHAHSYDLNKAKRMLKTAGFHGPVTVDMAVLNDNNLEQQLATIIQGIWSGLGIKINIVKLSETDDQNALVAKKYPLFTLDDGPPIYDPGYQLSYDQICHQQYNFTDMCVPAADRILNHARVEFNNKKRQQMYDQLARIWVSTQPRIDVYADRAVAVLAKGVTHFLYADELNLYYWGK